MATSRLERVSVDVRPEEHRRLKVLAALHGQTMREYILESVRERMRHERETHELAALTQSLSHDPVLKAVWENYRDAAYDHL